MKRIPLCLALLVIACSKPQLLLHERGLVRLHKGEDVVRLAHPKMDDGKLLAATGTAILAGGIFYPLYKMVRPGQTRSFVSFPVNEPGGNQLIVEPR